MIEIFKIMKGRDNKSGEEFYSRIDSDRTSGHSLKVKKRRVRTVVRQGSFKSQKVVNAWNSLLGKVVAAETEDRFE